ncbi:MAG: helix-turn-helix domain-containing protein [Rhizobiaceae bacterium]
MSLFAEDETGDATAEALGNDVRGLRKSRGLTLTELALKVGRSIGFISQVERGLSSPSIDDLRAIATALEVPTSWFFANESQNEAELGLIVRGHSRRVLGTAETGIVEELLSPDLGGSFEMFRSVFQPGAEMNQNIFRPTEEAGYVVSGKLQFCIDDQWFDLEAGDSFRFENKPYRWKNPGNSHAIVIWVVSPPVY